MTKTLTNNIFCFVLGFPPEAPDNPNGFFMSKKLCLFLHIVTFVKHHFLCSYQNGFLIRTDTKNHKSYSGGRFPFLFKFLSNS